LSEQKLISICIPTFNRCQLIKGLLLQLNDVAGLPFEVVVVNDGSTDGTYGLLEAVPEKLNYPLNIFHQENKGRASALKKAVMAANGEFVIIMDDDDRFVISCLEQVPVDIENDLNNLKSGREIAGLVYLADDINENKLVGTKFPYNNFVSNLTEIRADYHVKGDKKEVIRRSILQDVMYTVPDGEKRMPTTVLWARIAKKYDVIFKNTALIKKQYLSDGLTKNLTKNRVENPVSAMMGYFEVITSPEEIFRSKKYMLRNSINYFRFYFHLKNKFSIFYFLFAGIIGWTASIYDQIVIRFK